MKLSQVHNVSVGFGALGLLLMPFSTGLEDGLVVPLGLPFLMAAVLLNFGSLRSLFQSQQDFGILIQVGLMLALWVLVTTSIAPSPFVSLYRAVVFFLGFLFAVWILDISRNPNHFLLIVKSLLLGGVIISCHYIGNFAYKGEVFGFELAILQRFGGGLVALPWGVSNSIGGTLLLVLLAYFCFRPLIGKNWGIFVLLICTLALFLTFSRTSILLLLLAYLFMVLPTLRKDNLFITVFSLTIMVLLLATGAALLAATDSSAFEELLASRFDDENVNGLGGRVEIWQDRIRDLPDKFFFPNGYYSSLEEYDGVTAHSYLITTGLEQGALGLALSGLFGWALFSFFGKLNFPRLSSYAHPQFRFLWIVVFANIFVEDIIVVHQYCIYFWTLFGLTVAHHQRFLNMKNDPIRSSIYPQNGRSQTSVT